MYKSPIELRATEITKQIVTEQEAEFFKTVLSYVPNVDKKELLRALQYDRDQYDKGYADGKADAMDSIVRCKDCMFCNYHSSSDTYKCCSMRGMYRAVAANEFCSWGERIDNG